MSNKCYDLINLEKYQNKTFLYERQSLNKENIYSYETIIKETKKCLEYFHRNQVKINVGIAIDIKEHTPASCILLLSILNYNCHFYCLDFEETKDVSSYLSLSDVKYVISSKLIKAGNVPQQSVYEFTILDHNFYLFTLNSENKSFENVRLCYTIATSGSTGLPKMVHVPYKCIEPNVKALSSLLNITDNDIIYLGSPATFDPFIVELFLALENGASILITNKEIRLQPEYLIKLMFPEKSSEMNGVTIYQTTPSLFRLFGEENIIDVILNNKSSLRCLLLGGEVFPSRAEMKSWLSLDFTNKRIFNIYGITEISCWSSIHEITAKDLLEGCELFPLGKPLDDYTFLRIVNEFENVLPHKDCVGELEIGSSIRRCFIPQFDNDIQILEANDIIYRKTGDLVKRDKDALYYIGRINNTIKRLGKQICMDGLNKKIEDRLKYEKLHYKATCLWRQESTKLILYLVNEKNMNAQDKILIPNILQKYLEKHEQPDRIVYGTEWPLNRHGKLDRKQILELIISNKNHHNTAEKIFKDFLTNTMGLQLNSDNEIVMDKPAKRVKLSMDISFTQIGGTSFQALSLSLEICELLEDNDSQRRILEMLLDNKVTIKEMIEFLKLNTRIKKENTICDVKDIENLKTIYNLNLKWHCDLKKCIDSSPTIYQKKFVCVGSHSHLIKTLDALTGQETSCLELADRIECPVVFISANLAVVGCYDGFLYGFDFNNGCIMWKLNVKGMIKAKPLVVNNMIIIASYAEDCNVMAYDLKSLTLKWQLKLGRKGIFSSPLQISSNSILFCTLDGCFALVEADTGTVKWLRYLNSPIFSTATKFELANETFLLLAEVKGEIHVCNAENGNLLSSFQAQGNIFSGLTLHHLENHTLIIFGCHDKNVYCLKLQHSNKELTLNWLYNLNSAVYSTPILITNNSILACSTKGLIVLLDLFKADVLASYDLKAEIFSTPSCLNETYIYVGCRDNFLYAFELKK